MNCIICGEEKKLNEKSICKSCDVLNTTLMKLIMKNPKQIEKYLNKKMKLISNLKTLKKEEKKIQLGIPHTVEVDDNIIT